MSQPTIADVAEYAGVSKATVSRVLSGNYQYMRQETKARVEKAVQALNYRPSSIARSLTSKRTNTVAIMVSDITNPFYGDVIRGSEDAALEHDYSIYLCNTNYNVQRGLTLVKSLIDKRVDGLLIMASSMSDEWLDELAQHNTPAVVLDWSTEEFYNNIGVLNIDFQTGIRQTVEHLMTLGHRTVAHVSGPLHLQTSLTRRDRFLEALASYDINRESVPIIEGDLTIDSGRTALPKIMARSPRPTAVFAANDLMAMGLLAEARALDVLVPADLSVIGLDDIWLAPQTDPPLTTVSLPCYEIGKQAVEQLLCLIEDETPTPDVIETKLVIRESTGPHT